MDKKQFLLQTLWILGKERALAQVIKILLEDNELDNTFIDGLMKIMENFIETTQNQEKKKIMQKWVEMIQRLKNKEINEKKIDEDELKKLEELINEVK